MNKFLNESDVGNIWGPFHCGPDPNSYYICADEASANCLLKLFDKWKRNNKNEPDRLSLETDITNMWAGKTPSEFDRKIYSVCFQSCFGDASEKTVMHIRLDQSQALTFQDILVQADGRNKVKLIQVPATSATT